MHFLRLNNYSSRDKSLLACFSLYFVCFVFNTKVKNMIMNFVNISEICKYDTQTHKPITEHTHFEIIHDKRLCKCMTHKPTSQQLSIALQKIVYAQKTSNDCLHSCKSWACMQTRITWSYSEFILTLNIHYWDSHNYWPRSARVIYSSARVNNCGNCGVYVYLSIYWCICVRVWVQVTANLVEDQDDHVTRIARFALEASCAARQVQQIMYIYIGLCTYELLGVHAYICI